MSLLELTPPEKAEGKLAELYAESEQFFGSVPNNVRMLGVSPAVLENQFDFAKYFFAHPNLSVPFLAIMRMLLSTATDSPYCQGLNAGMLRQQGITAEQIEKAKADPRQAPVSDKEKPLLLFVLAATKDPHAVTADQIGALRNLGWTERDIFDALAHGARAVATNILFDAFKVGRDSC
jgi:alkylhydroperoxidase family enzyme